MWKKCGLMGLLFLGNDALREAAFSVRPQLDNLLFVALEPHNNEMLEAYFSEEETESCLRECNGYKAPGTDNFNFEFFHTFRTLLKDDILSLFNDFHRAGRFAKFLNSTFLVLIPKMASAKNIKDFRPISLVRSLYKLISEVLANRLSKVLHLIIDDCRHVFIKGRQITNAFMIANEIVDELLGNKREGVLCKLDVEKAFDHVNWNFVII